MNQSKLYIPDTIKVGYQNRSDTYTKKLAYVIYTDHTGKVRKGDSWEKWRDKSINPDEYKNEPTSGFVLNKKVGGYKSYWNYRQSYIRVYDPRGFEFEIGLANLLWILEETNSIVGKGLEGEFVYGWDGKDLILMPASSQTYKDCISFTKLQAKKLSLKDLVPGKSYRTADTSEYLYIGFYSHWERSWRSRGGTIKNRHIFQNSSGHFVVGMIPKEEVSDVIDPEIQIKIHKYLNTPEGSKLKKVRTKEFTEKDFSSQRLETIVKEKNTNVYYLCTWSKFHKPLYATLQRVVSPLEIINNQVRAVGETSKDTFYWGQSYDKGVYKYEEKELLMKNFERVYIECENGSELET